MSATVSETGKLTRNMAATGIRQFSLTGWVGYTFFKPIARETKEQVAPGMMVLLCKVVFFQTVT